MIVNLNDINSSIEIEFDTSSIETKITKKYNFDEYNIDYHYYEEKEVPKVVKIGGVSTIKIVCKRLSRSPDDEKEKDTIEGRNYNNIEIYNN